MDTQKMREQIWKIEEEARKLGDGIRVAEVFEDRLRENRKLEKRSQISEYGSTFRVWITHLQAGIRRVASFSSEEKERRYFSLEIFRERARGLLNDLELCSK